MAVFTDQHMKLFWDPLAVYVYTLEGAVKWCAHILQWAKEGPRFSQYALAPILMQRLQAGW